MGSGNFKKPTLAKSASVKRYINKHDLQITSDGILHLQRYLEHHLDLIIKLSKQNNISRLNALLINELQGEMFKNVGDISKR